MKFMDKYDIILGMRFYAFYNDDEFEVIDIVGIDEDNNKLTVMDEESSNTTDIDLEFLNDNYNMISGYDDHIYGCAKYDNGKYEWYIDEVLMRYLDSCINYTNTDSKFVKYYRLATYKYLTKNVFYNMMNTIINSDLGIDVLWELYHQLAHMTCDKFAIYSNKDSVVKFSDVVANDDIKLPDSVFDDIEELYGIVVNSYSLYEYDISIDLREIGMKYIVIYTSDEDKYFILIANNYTTNPVGEEYDYVTSAFNKL